MSRTVIDFTSLIVTFSLTRGGLGSRGRTIGILSMAVRLQTTPPSLAVAVAVAAAMERDGIGFISLAFPFRVHFYTLLGTQQPTTRAVGRTRIIFKTQGKIRRLPE